MTGAMILMEIRPGQNKEIIKAQLKAPGLTVKFELSWEEKMILEVKSEENSAESLKRNLADKIKTIQGVKKFMVDAYDLPFTN